MANKYLDLAGTTYLIGKIKTLLSGKADSNHTHTKADIGLGNVENKSSETIRGEITKANVTTALGYTPPEKDTNTWIAFKGATTSAAGTAGYAPAPAAGDANRYLRSDGTWVVPPDTNTTYSDMTGASASAAGKNGLVPAPAAGANAKFLRGDGTWQTPTNTTYSDATQSAHGLMSVADKKKLDGIDEGANKITVDTALSASSTNPVQNKVINTALGAKAPLASPTFTGTPKVPTAAAGTNTTQAASTAFVAAAITSALSGITGIDLSVVDALPTTGKKGVFYLISNSGSGQNIYDEYIWVNEKFEKLGTRELDLSGYMKTSDMSAISNTEIDTAFA